MDAVDRFYERINNLPMLPKVVQEVTALLNDSEVDIKLLAHTIDHDQVLSARVLCMSNSAYFGCSRTIKTIEDAVSIIGLRNLKTLVIASGITKAITEVPGLDLKKFWLSSLITASVARQLSKELKLDAESVYIAALMHNIGQLPIHMVFPSAAEKIDWECQAVGVLERCDIEQSMLGTDHCQIGEMLARHWNFPEMILRVIRYYADPFNENACPLAPVVNAAVHIAHGLETGKEAQFILDSLNANVAKKLGLADLQEFLVKVETYQSLVEEARAYV
ncbi:MAG TPA: histidine kinase [Methylophilaceae bacterium]|nr:histidine kinase [Methylophilaceae bacterium]HAJ71999.1 histidine kinase [Methylophilaceae bacterium]